MMIHWGLYAIPAGEWKGSSMEYIGEWIMSRYRIPIREYELLARQFNPVRFNAGEWVRLAKRAGMRYMVVVSKHHDGFAMFHSAVDPYNIYDATPYHRDVLAELAAACQREGLRLGVYYSQDLDWHEPNGGGTDPRLSLNLGGMSWGNNWDFPDHSAKHFDEYFNRKATPQVRELLTKYGPISLMWFDTPKTLSPAQADELYGMVRSLQPQALVNSRLGQGRGDFGSLGDNMVPAAPLKGPWPAWESIGTMNDTWGYKKNDHKWKSATEVLTLLTGLASKNINYLLNVGPMATGEFPEGSVSVLNEVGSWMERNGESVHEVRGSPFPHDLPWGPVTAKSGRLYLHLQKWPEKGILTIHGLRNPARSAFLLDARQQKLKVDQSYDAALELREVRVQLPSDPPKSLLPVLALEIDGAPNVEPGILQQGDGSVTLPAFAAEIHSDQPGKPITISRMGTTEGWTDEHGNLSWNFKVFQPGRFLVQNPHQQQSHHFPGKADIGSPSRWTSPTFPQRSRRTKKFRRSPPAIIPRSPRAVERSSSGAPVSTISSCARTRSRTSTTASRSRWSP